MTVKNVGTVGSMTLISRVTGLVRDIAFAQFLGSGALADAFFVAFRIQHQYDDLHEGYHLYLRVDLVSQLELFEYLTFGHFLF